MNTLRILNHLARADFLERIRRYSFLIMLGLMVFVGYAIASGQVTLMVGTQYRGVMNSAWVGGLMSAYIAVVLGFFGFYLIKGSIQRDYETGVGQIMATTPLKRPLYTLGKWFSNCAVLGIMVLILAVVAVIMQMVYREDPLMDWWALLSPFLLLVLPYMAFTAALVVVFETIPWLRGGLGNVIYFILYLGVIMALSFTFYGNPPELDATGWGYLNRSMQKAVIATYPDSNASFGLGPGSLALQTFRWDGIAWTADIVIARLVLLLISIGLAGLAAVFFDRFNPSRLLLFKRTKTESDVPKLAPATEAIPVSNVHLTPLTGVRSRFRFGALFQAELKLFLKGQRWWWYVIAVLLVIGPLGVSSIGTARTLLLFAWVWPILLFSGLGCRENRYDTRQIVFAAPHPIANQLPAAWLSAFVVTAVLGSGALVKFIILGETTSLLGWLTGVLFIPSLALCLGALTGSSKAFEVIFVAWMYMLTQKMIMIDFMAYNPNGQWFYYAPLALVLLAIAALSRQRQLTAKIILK